MGSLGHFLVEKIKVKNWRKVRLTLKKMAKNGQKVQFLRNFFSTKKRVEMRNNQRKLCKRRLSLNLGLFRPIFGRKSECQKLVKSKANPL